MPQTAAGPPWLLAAAAASQQVWPAHRTMTAPGAKLRSLGSLLLCLELLLRTQIMPIVMHCTPRS